MMLVRWGLIILAIALAFGSVEEVGQEDFDAVSRLPTEQQLSLYRRQLLQTSQDIASLSHADRQAIQRRIGARVFSQGSAISMVELDESSSTAVNALLASYSLAEQKGSEDGIMQSLMKLEDKIKAESSVDSDQHVAMETTCHETGVRMDKVISEEEASQKQLKLSENQMRNQRTVDKGDCAESQQLERKLSATVEEVQTESISQTESYNDRKRQRTSDGEALLAAVRFVCSFQSFTDDARCVANKALAAVPKPSSTELFADQSEAELRAEGKRVIQASEKAWEAQQVKDQADIRAGKTPEYDSTESRALSMVQMVEHSVHGDKHLRGQLSQTLSEPVRGPVTAVLLSVEAGDYEKADSLLDLIVSLIKQVHAEAEADKQESDGKQLELGESKKQAQTGLHTEQAKQVLLEDSVRTLGANLEASRTEFFRSAKAITEASKRRDQNNDSCEDEREAYRQRKQVADQELVNINKLRSLLQVLGGDGVPECKGDMADCTAAAQGMCIKKNSKENLCACEPGYYGVACEKKKCPGAGSLLYTEKEGGACSGANRGTCSPSTGKCKCTDEYSGDRCEFAKTCPGGGACNNGRGTCDKKSGRCQCSGEWYGLGCTERKCPGTAIGDAVQLYTSNEENVCAGHGVCMSSTGECGCHDGYQGASCAQRKCEDNCSGNGECMPSTGLCSCNPGYHGATCAYKACPGDCNGVGGRCNRLAGSCACNPWFSGPACAKTTTCDEKVTSYQDWAFWKQGWSKCPNGWLMTGVVTGTCTGIHCLDKAVCAKPCLGKQRLGLDRCYEENWWDSLNSKGWSRCKEGYYMAGLYRSKPTCNSIYCVEMALCCSIRNADYDHCQDLSWFAAIKNPESRATVPANKFMTGMYRAGINTQISDLRSAASCHFKSTLTSEDLIE
eukprot:TRINITY_DN49545_c0_g2_i1.p1 TRINITY_DN49545_c0_g2~~TRINITY_DN49545_c0_g2_i1.p1  ORF type:complete len:903 (+),score=225.65 TRINITY_DN49545_c0_g2_i1:131-2839(+)